MGEGQGRKKAVGEEAGEKMETGDAVEEEGSDGRRHEGAECLL